MGGLSGSSVYEKQEIMYIALLNYSFDMMFLLHFVITQLIKYLVLIEEKTILMVKDDFLQEMLHYWVKKYKTW